VGTPLIAKGQVKGVLEIFQRSPFVLNPEQRAFLEILAGQAAIAIDSAQLYETLHDSNFELMMAYDETIEGWSRAMDMRDKETEGHTQRVTELTLRLAASMGLRPRNRPTSGGVPCCMILVSLASQIISCANSEHSPRKNG
jgi:GAF domain-containing protein